MSDKHGWFPLEGHKPEDTRRFSQLGCYLRPGRMDRWELQERTIIVNGDSAGANVVPPFVNVKSQPTYCVPFPQVRAFGPSRCRRHR